MNLLPDIPLDPGFWIVQMLNGLQLSMLLFLLSVGLTVIFGLLHFINLAHGMLYALGAYLGVSLTLFLGSYWLALGLAPLGVLLAGMVLYLLILRRIRKAGPMNQVLVTFGLIFILVDGIRLVWGDIALGIPPPALLDGRLDFGLFSWPAWRLFLVLAGFAVYGILYALLHHTRVGIMVRAAVENDSMAACMGIHVERLFFQVFCLGCALAGLAGILAVPLFSATPDMGTGILIPTLIVVVIGGPGSLKGALVGSLLIGFLQTFGAVLIPGLSSILVYLLLACVLLTRPGGLYPARA